MTLREDMKLAKEVRRKRNGRNWMMRKERKTITV
jgi:hypothetical protein